MEYINAHDANMNIVGVYDRKTIHQLGLWHKTFHCWLITKHGIDNEPSLLFQKRSFQKKVEPGKYDITSAGHIMSNETVQDAVRELSEEIGVSIPYSQLSYLGMQVTVKDYDDIKDREFAYVHIYETDEQLENFKLQESEVLGIGMIKISEGLELFSDKRKVCSGVMISYKEGIPLFENLEINVADFVLRNDLYYLKICQQADLYIKGYNVLVV